MENLTYKIVRESVECSKIKSRSVLHDTMTNDIALAGHEMFKFLSRDFFLVDSTTLADCNGNEIMSHGDKFACDDNYNYFLQKINE